MKNLWRGIVAVCLGLMLTSAMAMVKVGNKAPDFSLKDNQGKTVNLSDFKDKVVVLEWSNYQCPFVKKHYQSGNIPSLQQKYTDKGVVWLTIMSSAPGKQGYYTPEQLTQQNGDMKNKASDVLRDSDGKVGKLYGAKTTPQFVIIDKKGDVAYTGAIDSIASTDVDDIKRADNYVDQALNAVLSNQAVQTKASVPYGCGVKY